MLSLDLAISFKFMFQLNLTLDKMLPKVCIVLFFTFGSVFSGNSDTCSSFRMKLEHMNEQLVDHSIAEVSVLGHHDCARECMTLSACKSFDFFGPNKTCKLNDVGSSSIDISEFIPLNGAIFSDISDWPSSIVGSCGPRPCAANQRCFQNMGNYLCQDITCGNAPWIDNGKFILSSLDKIKFLDTASVECNPGYVPIQSSVKCQLSGKWEKSTCVRVSDCKDIVQVNPGLVSGVYDVFLWKSGELLSVYCDMHTNGGGWTVFQKRFDGSTDFYRNYSEYQNGFGSVDGEFWLGLNYIQEMTEKGASELRIYMSKADGTEGYETFQDFSLTGPEYKLMIGTRTSSNAGEAVRGLSYNNGEDFSTYDHDRDTSAASNCATVRHGAWWYGHCSWTNLNGKYCTTGTVCRDVPTPYAGFVHNGFAGDYSLKTAGMMLRRFN